MKYFLKIAGSWCYGYRGLTFPKKVPLDFYGAIQNVFPAADIRWEPYLGWSNQPEVCIIEVLDEAKSSDLNRVLRVFDAPLEEADLYNRFHWSEYWGYDNNGVGAWGSIYDDGEEVL